MDEYEGQLPYPVKKFFVRCEVLYSIFFNGTRKLDHFRLLSLTLIVALPFYGINHDLTTVTEYPCLSSQTYFTTHSLDNRNIWNLRVLSRFIYTLVWHGAMSLFLCGHRSSPAFPKKFRLIDVIIYREKAHFSVFLGVVIFLRCQLLGRLKISKRKSHWYNRPQWVQVCTFC